MKKLQEVLLKNLVPDPVKHSETTNAEYLQLFLDAKRIEGCSERTLQYYRTTAEHLLQQINTPIRKMTTDEIRTYLVEYQQNGHCSKVTVDNIRRNISSFFSWLEEEDYILKSPMRRIHKIKTKTVVKEVISDESMERMRDACTEMRDLAMIDLLYSTGIRVGELVQLNISDVDLEQRECIVFGKGEKERRVYLCNLDYVMFGAFGVPLFREHTCFEDGDYCDFKLKINEKPMEYWPPVFGQGKGYK
jgi:integrase/recombinase XerD